MACLLILGIGNFAAGRDSLCGAREARKEEKMAVRDGTTGRTRQDQTTGEKLCGNLGGVVVWNVRLRVPREGW